MSPVVMVTVVMVIVDGMVTVVMVIVDYIAQLSLSWLSYEYNYGNNKYIQPVVTCISARKV